MKLKCKFDDVDVKNLNLSEICRFCLSNNGILLGIFGPRMDDHLIELPSQIKTILSIEMSEEDGLPSMICHNCLFDLERSIDFKKQCEQADSILRNYLQEKTIKQECLPTDEDKKISEETDQQEQPQETCDSQVMDTDCQVKEEKLTIEDVSLKTEEPIENMVQEYGRESTHDIMKEDPIKQEINEVAAEVETKVPAETVLEMEESMNDLEDGMYGSEPFSLDLCSVRLRSEGQYDEAGEDMVVYPTTQLTDEDQWSESGSDISDELESRERTRRQLPLGVCNCPTCNKAFPSSAALQRHQLIHKQEPPFPCDYCNSDFEEKTLLKAHWRAHAKHKPHMCLTCGEAYLERSDLVKHFAVHDVIKPYHCPGCGKAFAYRSDLRKHAIIHTGARPFKCPVCGKTFTRSTNLNKHARVHSGRRPYPCDHCHKMFSSRGDLVRHAVIHTGEKPYACLICSLAFNRKDKLSRHERVHMTDRPFVCPECPTSFHRKEELTKHSKFHHFKPDPKYLNLPAE